MYLLSCFGCAIKLKIVILIPFKGFSFFEFTLKLIKIRHELYLRNRELLNNNRKIVETNRY